VYVNAREEIVVAVEPPSQMKKRGVFFMRKSGFLDEPISRSAFKSALIYGELSAAPLDLFSTLVEDVFVDLIRNSRNTRQWPAVVSSDILRNLNSIKGELFMISGGTRGRTLLPVPESSSLPAGSPPQAFLHAIESAVIDWSHQVRNVLKAEPPAPVMSNDNHGDSTATYPSPYAEVDFWVAKAANMRSILDQLSAEKIRKAAKALSLAKSTYYTLFRQLVADVVTGVRETGDLAANMKAIRAALDMLSLDMTSFEDLPGQFRAVLRTVTLAYIHCAPFRSARRVANFLGLLDNYLVEIATSFIQPEEILRQEPDEARPKLGQAIQVLSSWFTAFHEAQARVAQDCPGQVRRMLC
jgi:dynein heavy chain, axonemal